MSDEQQKQDGGDENIVGLLLNPDVPVHFKLFFVAGVVIYTLSPIDFIPDVLGPLGFADDVGIWVVASQAFSHLANKHLAEKEKTDSGEGIVTQPMPPEQGPPQIRAQSAPPSVSRDGKPRLPESHLRRHNQPVPGEGAAPVETAWGRNALEDEPHEQFLKQHKDMSNEEFDKLMERRRAEREAEKNWDFSRNDRFAKRRDNNTEREKGD